MMWGYGNYGQTGTWIGMGIMMFFGLLVVIGLIVLIVWAASPRRHHAAGAGGQGTWTQSGWAAGKDDAWEIARQRYARGEISEDELQRIRQNLGR